VKVLVTGGAGYIGSVTTAHLLERGHGVVVLDDLSTGHRAAIPEGAEFVQGRVQGPDVLATALDGVDAVVHFASLSLVGESMQEPRRYFRENVGAALALLDGMDRVGVKCLVFSSTAAVYGEPAVEVITEDTPLRPVNPYGHSKVMIERVLAEEARANGLAAIALRYFNACGADGPRGEDHEPETHLIPRLCQMLLGELQDFRVHGDDHPTPDGTPVRDYVHVRDLAVAHALALEALGGVGAVGDAARGAAGDAARGAAGGAAGPEGGELGGAFLPGFEAINLGTGHGASVREVLAAAGAVTGREIPVRVGPRREGDPPRLVASNVRAQERLGWRPECSGLERIVSDAFAWHREHPQGYADD